MFAFVRLLGRTVFVACVSLLVGLAQPAPVGAPELYAIPDPDGLATDNLDLREVTLDSILVLLQEKTGRAILRPQALPTPTFTIKIQRPITNAELVFALETLLRMNGLSVTSFGDQFLKITQTGNERSEVPELIEGSVLELPTSSRVVMKIYRLNFMRFEDIQGLIQNTLNAQTGGHFNQLPKSNTFTVTDTVANLQRLEVLINQLDRPPELNMKTKFYSLRYAKASDLVNKIRQANNIGPIQMALSTSTSLNADDRTNQILLIGDERQFGFFDDLIEKLDVRADPNTRNEVIYLKHAAAKDVASLLSQLVSGQNNTNRESASVRPGQGLPPAQPGQPQPQPLPPGEIGPTFGLNTTTEFSRLLTILPDERSNAVVVSGTVDDIRLIRELVEKVDIVLAQVRIEVVIAEVSLDDSSETGISALGLQVSGDKLVGFAGSTPGLSVGGSGENAFATITRGAGTTGRYDLAGVISLTANSAKSKINVLANPTLVTTHNKEASIFVGESRPVFGQIQTVDTVTTGTTTGVSPSALRSSITQQEAGIQLKIKPLIGPDGTVQLEIEQTFNAFGLDVALGEGLSQPSINKREAKSFLNVSDKEIVVLGGYQSNQRNKSRSRLGPIPILGDLLGPRTARTTRTELMVFIRPHVIRGVGDTTADALTKLETSSDPAAVRKSLEWQTAAPPTPRADEKKKAFDPRPKRK